MDQSIHIILSDVEPKNGKLIKIVDKEVVTELENLAREREQLHRIAIKLQGKNDQARRHGQKLMWRFIKSHGVIYNEETEAVGVSNSNIIYVGPKDRVSQNPNAEPHASDRIKTNITKYERRKYNELLASYQYINEKIVAHNLAVEANELKLIGFEMNILENQEYDKEKQALLISSKSGKVFLIER